MSKDRRLGRGLAALLGSESENIVGESFPAAEPASIAPHFPDHAPVMPTPENTPPTDPKHRLVRISVQEIDDNPYQPRRDFNRAEIDSLAESLEEHDMLQPVLVRSVGDRYQLISGERRLRAAIQAGWSTVPAQIREADDRLVAELAIVENLQRKDLNPIEKAISFKRYLDQHDSTQEELAKRLKIDRSTISNLLRLLELPTSVVNAVQEGRLSAGHARALLPLGDEPLQTSYAEQIAKEQWSVREAEQRVQEQIANEDGQQLRVVGTVSPTRPRQSNKQVAALEQGLRMAIGSRVDIKQGARGRGKIVIHFSSHAEFERIHQVLADSHPTEQIDVGS